MRKNRERDAREFCSCFVRSNTIIGNKNNFSIERSDGMDGCEEVENACERFGTMNAIAMRKNEETRE